MADGIYSERWLRWETPHFTIFAHEGAEEVGQASADRLEAAYSLLRERFGWDIRHTFVVVEDWTDSANGSARVVPRNRMRFNAVPPTPLSALGHYDDWLTNLIIHELTHVFHLERTGGIPWFINRFFLMSYYPNHVMPRWFVEGLATWFESELTGAGRLNSAAFDAWWRGAALAGTFPEIGDLAGNPVEWPYGSGWYLYGSHFIAWLVDNYGFEPLIAFIDDYGRRVLPLRINATASEIIGTSLVDAWPLFRAQKLGEAWAQSVVSHAQSSPHGERLSRSGHNTRYVDLAPDGEVAWIIDGTLERPQLVLNRRGEERRVLLGGSGSFSFLSPGQVVVDQSHNPARGIDGRDLFVLDLLTQELVPLTWGERASSPAVSPDGRRVAYASFAGPRTELRIVNVEDGSVQTLVSPPGFGQADEPTWLDDDTLVFAQLVPGEGRDLYRVSLASGVTERLTQHRGMALSPRALSLPAQAGGGRAVVYSSDRGGVLDAWLLYPESGKEIRLTHDAIGVFNPLITPDGRLIYSRVGEQGFDVWEAQLQGSWWVPPGEHLEPAPGRILPPTPVLEGEPVDAIRRQALVRRMQWPEWSWILGFASGFGEFGGRVDIADAPGANQLTLSAAWDFTHNSPVLAAAFVTRRLPFTLSLSASRNVLTREERLFAEGRFVPYREERYESSIGVSTGLGNVRGFHALSVSYSANWYRMLDRPEFHHDPADLRPYYPEFLRYNTLRFGWGASTIRREPGSFSVSSGQGATLGVGLRSKLLGAQVETADFSATWTGVAALANGKLVLISRLAGGIAVARGTGRQEWVLGGVARQDILQSLMDQAPAPDGAIRGYRPGAQQGSRFFRAQSELRFPLWNIGKGAATLPLYASRLHGAIFYDTGFAVRERPGWGDLLHGVGAELRLLTTLGYTENAMFRLGVARGFGEDGIWDGYLLYGFEF